MKVGTSWSAPKTQAATDCRSDPATAAALLEGPCRHTRKPGSYFIHLQLRTALRRLSS